MSISRQLPKRGGVYLSTELVVKLLEFSLRFTIAVLIESVPFPPSDSIYLIYASKLFCQLVGGFGVSHSIYSILLPLKLLFITSHICLHLQDVWHCEICNRKPGRGFGKHHFYLYIFLTYSCFQFDFMLSTLQRQQLRSYRDYAKSNMRVVHWKNYCILICHVNPKMHLVRLFWTILKQSRKVSLSNCVLYARGI